MKPAASVINRCRRLALLLCLAGLGTAGCDGGGDQHEPAEAPAPRLSEEESRQLSLRTRTAWYIAEPVIASATASAGHLREAVEALLEKPSDDTLGAARKQWQHLATDYSALDIYTTLAQLTPDTSELRRLTFNIAAYPIEPGYLDSIGPYRYSGLVHDVSLPLSATTLREQHGLTQKEDAALGLYAMGFMLFGEVEQPRQADDYRARAELAAEEREHGYSEPAELPQNRRRELLRIQAQLLVEDLQRLASLWRAQTPESLYLAFVQMEPERRFNLLLRSAQVEISEMMGLLESTRETGESLTQAPSRIALAKEAAHLAQVMRVMRLDESLSKNLAQAAQALEEEDSGNTSVQDSARGHLEKASLVLAEELARFAPHLN